VASTPTPLPLTAQLRVATRGLHTEAERAGIMPALLRGQLAMPVYVALLRNLHALYATLEAALTQHAGDPRTGPLHLPAIFRCTPIELDLQVLDPQGETTRAPLTDATLAYVSRLQALAAGEPERLVAHAYVRYLGDLSGGQVLSSIVARLTAGASGPAVAFYSFGDEAAVKALASAFRHWLDALPLTPTEVAAVVDEAQWAFRQHRQMFEALAVSA
jgi:heme oxygenase